MDTVFDPQKIESTLADYWEKAGYFLPSGEGSPYCIVLPPPNVTGSLHMGHGFQQTLMDVLTRYHRMQGDNTLWQGGVDHAGIATQMVVERQLSQQGLSRHDLGRDTFIKRIWAWKEKSGACITQQVRRLGASLDWSREAFTMDEQSTRATKTAFIRLHEEGLIYRGKRLVNWDPKFSTAISDLEVDNVPREGKLWHIRYPLASGDASLVIATTRPETMLADAAVAVHPEDERYQQLIGEEILLPLSKRTIPIISDDTVDREFGTGCVKITPAHDFNDYEMGKRHSLPMQSMLTMDMSVSEDMPEAYRGLDRFAARKKVVADLEAEGFLEKIESHTHNVPIGKRSGEVVEPMLTDQWFVAMKSLAKPAIDAVKQGDLQFVPSQWTKTYLQWLDGIQDWCISRQLWWGHRIPAWYDEAGKVYVGEDEATIRAAHDLSDEVRLTQDNDVLDTWFTSALWPMATLGFPDNTPELATFYPTSVLVTGFDIIFFWVARMVMMGLKFLGKVPFKTVYITGLIRDSEGQKMSKSKGNVLDPVDLIDGISLDDLLKKRTGNTMLPEHAKKIETVTKKAFPEGIAAFGCDALRFTYCALASNGRDINFSLARVAGYRNFCNKLWNAARFVLMRCNDMPQNIGALSFSDADNWVQEKLNAVTEEVHRHLAQYRFDLLANTLYEFVWHEFCGWYLELTKAAMTPAAEWTLLTVLEKILRLLHPIIPFITETIWQDVAPKLGMEADTIMLQDFPVSHALTDSAESVAKIEWVKSVVTAVRSTKASMNIAPGKPVTLLLRGNAQDRCYAASLDAYLRVLAKAETIVWAPDSLPADVAHCVVGSLDVFMPLAGLVDMKAELARRAKEIQRLEKEIGRLAQKLKNAKFIANAPDAVVQKEREKLFAYEESLTKLRAD